MQVIKTEIPDVLILKPTLFGDDRGFFMESFNKLTWLEKTGVDVDFVQDNHSRSTKGVLRGLHYQIKHAQGKLVRVVSGQVFDVAVDLRKSSATFGKWVGVTLSEENRLQFWVPPGFAHGFMVLSEQADFLYKATDYYAPEFDRSIIWNDSELNISWPLGITPELSAKDSDARPFSEAEVYP